MNRADDAAAIIKTGSHRDMDQLKTAIAQDRESGSQLLRELANSNDVEVRAWVTGAARLLLDRPEALNVLELLADDRDGDVRSEALRELLELDARWARRAAERYMRILRSADVLSVIDAMWGLVRLREQAALEPIRNLASNPKERLVANNARVAALVLEGDERALLEPLELHDHARVPMSIKGLAYLATPKALAALMSYAKAAPDDECARRAKAMLEVVDEVKPLAVN